MISISLVFTSAVQAFTPVFKPSLETSRLTSEIDIDGYINLAEWQHAGRAGNFVERSPGDNLEPPVGTEAFITYDENNLYVAFICKDDPADVRATMCQRDQYANDDAVGLMIDTYGEAVWAYEFFVNPYGIQKDLMWTNVQGEDRGFDLVWHSAAQISEDGYTVEMAIPLAGLRFPDREIQNWKVDFWRVHPRESFRQYSWSANDRNEQCFPCQWGTVEGIEGISPGKGLEVLPSFIGYRTGQISDTADADSGFDTNDPEGDFSLGAKYSLSSDITAEGTLNPDFSQIEADADQIDVNSTIVQLFPERRPFFQEGNDLFRTMFNSFYTRMVNDPKLAAKGTMRGDRTSVAYLMARDEHSPYIIPTEERSYSAAPGKSTVNVLRGLHSLGNNSQIGMMATDRRYDDGGSGTILAGDASIRLSNTYSWVGQFVHSRTREPEGYQISAGETFDKGAHTVDLDGESYTGNAFITQFRRRARNLNLTVDYNQVNPTYRTQTGYDPWNDQRNFYVFTNYNFWPQTGIFENITPSLFVNGRWNTGGKRKWAHYQGALNTRLGWAQTRLGLRYTYGSELWGDTEFDNLWSVNLNGSCQPSDMFGFFAALEHGRNPALRTLDKGNENSISLTMNFKPFDRLIIEPTLDYIKSSHSETGAQLFEQTILRTRLRYQASTRLSLRLVVQHNNSVDPYYRSLAQAGNFDTYHMYFGRKWEIDPLLVYRINSLSVFYLGATHDYRDFNAALPGSGMMRRMTERQFFTKIQYLFQI